MTSLAKALNIDDLAEIARRRVPRGIYEFIDRGAEDEVTLRENAESIKRIFLRPRVGVDVSSRDISTAIFDVRQAMPIGLGATGLAALTHRDGERKMARAAAAARIPYTLGTSNFTSQSELKEICGDLLWRLIYPNRNREIVEHHLKMAREVGIRTLVITMDSAVMGNREYLQRSGLRRNGTNARTWLDIARAPHWLFGTLLPYLRRGFPQFVDMPAGERLYWGGNFSFAALADDFTWDEVRSIRARWPGQLVLKGISTAEDARIAAHCGADGIIVSNHGGRMLDGCIPSILALPEIVDAVSPAVTVMVDGGFRRGADVLKAVALGAACVFMGRVPMFGLIAGGEAGVARAIAILKEEIDRALALTGCTSVAELDRSYLSGEGISSQPPRHIWDGPTGRSTAWPRP